MSGAVTGGRHEISPQLYARIGGLLDPIIIVAGLGGELFIRGAMVVSGRCRAMARNITASPLLWRVGIAGDLVMHMCDVGLMLVFYVLLRPVNHNLALLALIANLVQSAMLVANKTNLLVPLFAGRRRLSEGLHSRAAAGVGLRLAPNPRLRLRVRVDFLRDHLSRCRLLDGQSGYLPKLLGLLMQSLASLTLSTALRSS